MTIYCLEMRSTANWQDVRYRKHPVQHHLSLAYLTHWRPLPTKPVIVAEQ